MQSATITQSGAAVEPEFEAAVSRAALLRALDRGAAERTPNGAWSGADAATASAGPTKADRHRRCGA